NSSGAALVPPVNKAGGRVNGAAGANHNHERSFSDLVLDTVHLQRGFAEENNVRAQSSAAGTAGHFIQTAIEGAILDRWMAALALAPRFGQLAVHVEQVHRTGALMQVVHILRAEEELPLQLRLELGNREVSGIRLGLLC